MCADILSGISLYKNVKITRDYSVVHDLTPLQWMQYLENINSVQTGDPSPPVRVWSSGTVNYYRLPDVIRLEGKYDEIRAATYGMLTYVEGPDTHIYFFWVDSVRLVKASSTETAPRLDVVELSVTLDVWSTNQGKFKLYDSHVVRRHVDRWTWIGNPGMPYIMNTAVLEYSGDNVETEYQSLSSALPVIPQAEVAGRKWDIRFMVVCTVNGSGGVGYCLGGWAYDPLDKKLKPLYIRNANPSQTVPLMNLQSIRDGDVPAIIDKNVGDIQSILIIAPPKAVLDAITLTYNNGVYGLCPCINGDDADFFATYGLPGRGSQAPVGSGYFLSMVLDINTVKDGLQDPMTTTLGANAEIGPDPYSSPHLDGSNRPDPTWAHITYYEPMLFRSPAQFRQIVNKLGTVIFKVPDILTMQTKYTVVNTVDINTGAIMVYGGQDPEKANGSGNIGAMQCPSLPITSSAWKNYQAIQKTGDDIVYNAKQTQAIVSTLTGAAGGAAAGAFFTGGNPAGAAVGLAGGVVNGAVGYWSNSEELRAKRNVIRNSPGIVKAGSDGLGGGFNDYYDIKLQTVKAPAKILNILDKQYFFYGYNVDEYTPGEISLHTRYSFDYIETRRANVRGDVNSEICNEVAAIFDRGVRIYHGSDGYKRIGESWAGIKENWELDLLAP